MPGELVQQRNLQIPPQNAPIVTLLVKEPLNHSIQMNPTQHPNPPQDAAAVGSRYQAELLSRCAQGEHQVTRTFGLYGIIAAVVLFPCGLICLFKDSQRKCSRCGEEQP